MVAAELAPLKLGHAKFRVALEALDDDKGAATGLERIVFEVATVEGASFGGLARIASGGELSRISLAIEVATLGMDDVGTMVFDEVDSGIGGAVAEVVGKKLRRLGGKRQVLCVTHLPQVAAQAHAHLRVVKSSDAKSIRIAIETLGP